MKPSAYLDAGLAKNLYKNPVHAGREAPAGKIQRLGFLTRECRRDRLKKTARNSAIGFGVYS